jgi:hypothetical protein
LPSSSALESQPTSTSVMRARSSRLAIFLDRDAARHQADAAA